MNPPIPALPKPEDETPVEAEELETLDASEDEDGDLDDEDDVGDEYDDEDEDEDDEPIQYAPAYYSLMVVGLLGSAHGRHEDADVIDRALDGTLPEPNPYQVYRPLAQALGDNGAAGAASLKAYVDKNPQDDSAKVILAVSLMMAGDASWMQVIENLLASSADAEAREAARNLISYLRARR